MPGTRENNGQIDYSEETRKIYHAQHTAISRDVRAMDRFINMFSHEYFGVPTDFFNDKKILDAGCGDTGKVLVAMYRLGARNLHGFDLGEEFIPVAKESLTRQGVPLDTVRLSSGNILSIPYPDESFDFVICHGVLLHLNSLDEVEQGFAELARVTRHHGYLYTVYGTVGGLFEDAIIPAVREYYRTNKEFKSFIDDTSPEKFTKLIDFIQKEYRQHEESSLDLEWLKPLLDVDFLVFLQNVLQVPVRLKIDEPFIKKLYMQNGFSSLQRLHRYVKRKNIRKVFSPLHYHYESPVSQMLYGSGNLEFIAQKA